MTEAAAGSGFVAVILLSSGVIGSRVIGCAALLLVLLAAMAPGCAGRERASAATDDAFAAPVVHGARAGLEMRIWVLRDGAGGASALEGSAGPVGLGEALGPYLAEPGPLSQVDQALWSANGLRLVRVPVDQLGGVQAALGSPGAIQRQWLGEHPEWMELLRGPQTGRQVVRLDSGLMTLDPGRLRLLGRCWVSPRLPRAGAAPRAEVRVDLAVQHQPPARSRSLRELVDRPRQTPIEQAGVVFSRFVLELGLSGDEALLIVPERPEADWSGEDKGNGGAKGPPVVGPPAPRLPTLGEAMLWSDAGDLNPRAARPVRVIVALIPRLPERLELAAAPSAR